MGTNVVGVGFLLEPDEALLLITEEAHNKNIIFPFINGQDLNSHPEQKPSRYTINFFDWPLERAKNYRRCLEIVQERVYPDRMKSGGGYAKYWWQFGRRQERLYKALQPLIRGLIVAQTSKTLAFTFIPKGLVYSHATIVFALDKHCHFALLQSNFHTSWVLQYGSTLKGDARYIPTDCFDTYPFPVSLKSKQLYNSQFQSSDDLDQVGEQYYDHRRQTMLSRQEGLTKTYNRFHNPGEASDDIAELRRLHVEMDAAVAATYGWGDLELGHGFHETKQGLRYTLNEAARREVLDRLLALNHERYAEEVMAGLHDKGAKKAGAKGGRGKKVSEGQGELF